MDRSLAFCRVKEKPSCFIHKCLDTNIPSRMINISFAFLRKVIFWFSKCSSLFALLSGKEQHGQHKKYTLL